MLAAAVDVRDLLLVFGPAALGLVAAVAGVVLMRRAAAARAEDSPSTLATALGLLLLLLAFGIGTCYALVFGGELLR